MLSESVAIGDSLTSSPVYVPWIILDSACASQVITDLRACCYRVVLRRGTAKTRVSAGIMKAPLRTRQHQDLGCPF